MKKNRIICLLLWLVIILSFGTVSAQADEVGYKFAGSEEGDGFVLRISLQNVKALSGRLAIAFDTEKLEIADISSLSEAVEKSSEVNISPEGLDNSVLMSNKDGYIMFAWYAARNAGIDALSGAVEIASIKFNLKDGVTTDDFSRNTISLYYVNETMVDKWDCSAGIVDNNLDMYRNNAFSDDYRCGITYDYPNCDYVPIVTYDAVIRVTDATGNPLKATVWADNIQSQTDSNGYALFPMENGVYTYRVSALGYESKSGYIIIKDTAAQVGVQLRSYEQLLENIADNLSIGFTDGDGANSVTAGISLPQSGEYGEVITWKSSNSAVISDEGFVIRTDEDCSVRLTATLSLGTATTKRTFDVTVKSKQTTEEKNTAAVEKDLQSLVITYAPGDSENSVTADLSLPEMGANGSTVVWSSSDEDIVNKYGMVARPEQDTEIVLTALVMRGSAQRTKTFKITVKGESKQSASTDDEIINSVLSALAIGYSDGDSAESVTKQLNLPVSGADGTVIEWSSSQPAVVTAYGGVVRQAQDVSITLTATAAKGNVSKSKTFVVLVKAALQIPVNPDNGTEEEIKISNGSNAGGNGFVETPTPTTAPTATDKPTMTDIPQTERFSDIASVPWAREAILTLAERGVISGTGETTYSPQNPIRRADFVMLLVRLLDIDGRITDTFDDVAADKYYYESVNLAKSMGIISGIGENKFNPEGRITRQDMMTMTYRALSKLNMTDTTTADLSVFSDADKVADYAYSSISYLAGKGYVSGDDMGNLNPVSDTTRAETAIFLYKLGI